MAGYTEQLKRDKIVVMLMVENLGQQWSFWKPDPSKWINIPAVKKKRSFLFLHNPPEKRAYLESIMAVFILCLPGVLTPTINSSLVALESHLANLEICSCTMPTWTLLSLRIVRMLLSVEERITNASSSSLTFRCQLFGFSKFCTTILIPYTQT